MDSSKKVSIVICVYQNADNFIDTIESIIKQDYTNIELVIIDDCSFFFPEEEIREYIQKDDSSHIKSYSILRNEKNIGTVLTLKRALANITGEYYITMGGDDMLASEKIVSSYVHFFDQNPDKMWVCANEINISEYSGKILEVAPTEYDKEILASGDVKKNWNIWARRGVLNSAAVCYSSKVLDDIGYDASYKYIEDWPLFCRLLKMGYAPGYIDVPAFYHSRGGISDVNISEESRELKRQFLIEKQRIFRNEVDPFRRYFTLDSKRKYRFYFQEFITKPLFIDYQYKNLFGIKKRLLSLKKMFWLLERQYWSDRKRFNRNVFKIRELVIFSSFLASFFLFQIGIIGKCIRTDILIFIIIILMIVLGIKIPMIIEKCINRKMKKRYLVTHE